jgi:NADPH:quinone reductase-like Zn-dependent oxidoreductase
MFAVKYDEYGEPGVLHVGESEEPHAGPGQVRIAVQAVGVNPFDWKLRMGAFKDMFPTQFPAIPGSEAAGIVDEVGEGVEEVKVGDNVFGIGQATTAEFAVLDHFEAAPPQISSSQAAGIATAAEAALRSLEILDLKPGQTLLIDGAAGGVGNAAAQFAVADGLVVIGTASAANHEHLRRLGVIPTTYGPGLAGRVAQLAPSGVDAALDVAGQGSLAELVAITGSGDSVLTIADFSAAEHGVQLTTQASAFHALKKAAGLIWAGKYTVTVDSTYDFADAKAAHERSQRGHARGKIVLNAPRTNTGIAG